MSTRIEDYALIGDCHAAALVAKDGSIDWLCLPRFDSGACFAGLLGTHEHGRWLLTPAGASRTRRRYREGTLVLETEHETDTGTVTVIDCMPPRGDTPTLVRMVVGKRGVVPMRMQLVIRFDYGSIVPWVRRTQTGIRALAGPDALLLDTPVELHGEDLTTVADFQVAQGQQVPFVLRWQPCHESTPPPIEPEKAIRITERWWRRWSSRCTYQGSWRDAVLRSVITLKALTYAPTGGIVAAATTSLPEQLGGVRNWDYRICWVRDATFTLYALMLNGYTKEAQAWRDWLLRAVAGTPSNLRIMYGLGGERRLPELELDWLPGYEDSRPVRIGNAASTQFQLDVFGEVVDSLYMSERVGLKADENAWRVARALVGYLEKVWRDPDEGIWEVRGPRRHFTHSKVMAWVAADRMVKAAENFGLDGPVEGWRNLRDTIHAEVCERGFDAKRNSFVQYFGSKELDASLLMIPLVGFLPASDPRVGGTVAAIERHLKSDGLVARYSASSAVDGLPPGEGAFLACSFWLADNLALQGRHEKACELFEQLLQLRNDVGLLAEEYDPVVRRQVGNFPQAFSHVGLVNTASNLCQAVGPATHRIET
ncbi:MAG: glycoside hydrolase family 15 protein [Gemmataceae bacterium]|nr:glycoside hydrolase family 15 protein [Gemmataceae bacterium]